VWTVPRLCEFYLGICLTNEKKARKNLSQGKKNLSQREKPESESYAVLYRVAAFRRNPFSAFRVEENPSIEIYNVDHNRDNLRWEISKLIFLWLWYFGV